MYCGNNRLDERVTSGRAVIGTRYDCFRRGVGTGLHQPPYDDGPYDPIYQEKIYCGKSDQLPQGYDRFGSLSQCFQKGVGVGKSRQQQQRRRRQPPPPPAAGNIILPAGIPPPAGYIPIPPPARCVII